MVSGWQDRNNYPKWNIKRKKHENTEESIKYLQERIDPQNTTHITGVKREDSKVILERIVAEIALKLMKDVQFKKAGRSKDGQKFLCIVTLNS